MEKTVASSRTYQVHIVRGEHINGMNKLFGGKLMEWIDVTAAVAARRHCGCNVTTATVDHLDFHLPASANDTLVMVAQLTHVGRSSMEVRVDSFVEALTGKRALINRAYLVMVALDEAGKPTEVPRLIPETPEEMEEFKEGKQRGDARQLRRKKTS